jgi:tetratricopeptide (TPR) repeat protein
MRSCLLVLLLSSAAVWAQSNTSPANSSPADSQGPSSESANSPRTNDQSPNSQLPDRASSANKPGEASMPSQEPPRSDRVNADSLDNSGDSSSKDTEVDLSPPTNDAKTHPQSSEAVLNAEMSDSPDASQVHPWDPHKAAKDVEVGDFYFKRKNYRAAEDRYREALLYKDNDALATFRLAECLEKMGQPDEALVEYESYLKILPYGPESRAARKAMDRLTAADAKPAK